MRLILRKIPGRRVLNNTLSSSPGLQVPLETGSLGNPRLSVNHGRTGCATPCGGYAGGTGPLTELSASINLSGPASRLPVREALSASRSKRRAPAAVYVDRGWVVYYRLVPPGYHVRRTTQARGYTSSLGPGLRAPRSARLCCPYGGYAGRVACTTAVGMLGAPACLNSCLSHSQFPHRRAGPLLPVRRALSASKSKRRAPRRTSNANRL
jgi:hypothetical protein